MAEYKTDITKRELDDYLRKLHEGGHSMKSTEVTRKIYVAARIHYGGWKKALTSLNTTQEVSLLTNSKRLWSAEDIERELRKHLERGHSKSYIHANHGALYATINRNYGSIEHFAEKVGLDLKNYNFRVKLNYRRIDKEEPATREDLGVLSRHETEVFIDETIANLGRSAGITPSQLLTKYPKEYASIKKHFGSVASAFTNSGLYILDKKVPKNWSKSFLLQQIRLGYEQEEPLNTDYIIKFAPSAENYARNDFGSWRLALEESGIPNQYYNLDSQASARAGHVFEGILGEILTSLGIEFSKYAHEKFKPDFVSGSHWIDAKLSLWTVSKFNKGTIQKYEPFCNKLTIIFLRGKVDYDEMVSDKTRLVSVFTLLKELPDDVRATYEVRLKTIIESLEDAA